MRKVYKYPIIPADVIELFLPAGAQMLHVAEQSGQLCLWALVDPDESGHLRRSIRMAGTGHPIEGPIKRYINTILMHDGALVFHFFEV